jgi:hypothetical protein
MKERPPLRDRPAGPMPALLIPLLGLRYPKSGPPFSRSHETWVMRQRLKGSPSIV